jgi:dipeptidase
LIVILQKQKETKGEKMKRANLPDNMERGNCSTIIIGKDASVTGKVLLGHNEDDTNCVVATHLVPRIKHAEGETIVFDDGSAAIPQVEETYSYYWSEVRCEGGISFADGFINEWGLAVVSNAARPSNDPSGNNKDNKEAGKIGYGLRRLVAERAKTAREAVEIAGELVEKYGYFSSRSYEFADKDEAWVFQIPKGYNFAARRVGDDEIFYIPNWYTIHEIDFNDIENNNFYWSKNLVENAIKHNWYTPKNAGDHSDFDFAKAYQCDYENMAEYNTKRARNAWRMLTGNELDDSELKPFSMKAGRKYSRKDLKEVLRSHFEGSSDDETNGYEKNPHRGYYSPYGICNAMTVESMIIEFNEDVNLTRILRASPKPCVNPYTPWYPVALTRIPDGYEWIGPLASQKAHFAIDENEIYYNPNKAWWAFRVLQYFTDFDYKNTHVKIHKEISELEKAWDVERIAVESGYNALKNVDTDAAKEFLTNYTCATTKLAWEWANKMISKLGEDRIYENCADWGEFKK